MKKKMRSNQLSLKNYSACFLGFAILGQVLVLPLSDAQSQAPNSCQITLQKIREETLQTIRNDYTRTHKLVHQKKKILPKIKKKFFKKVPSHEIAAVVQLQSNLEAEVIRTGKPITLIRAKELYEKQKKLTDAYIEALAPYTTNKTTTCTSNSIPVFGTKLGSFLNNTITSDYFWVNHCTKSTLTSPNYSGLSSYFELRKNGNFFLNMDYNRGEDFLLSNGSKVRTYKYWRAPIYEKTNTGQLPKARNTIFAPGHSIIYDSVYESNGLRYSFRTALPMNIEETQEFLTDKRKFEDWILRVEVGFNQFLNTNSATIAPKECAAAQAPVSSALPATNTSISNSENEPSEGLEAD